MSIRRIKVGNAEHEIESYVSYGTGLYPWRINGNGTFLQIFRNGVWANVIKSCTCREVIPINKFEEIDNYPGYHNFELSDTLVNQVLTGKVLFPQALTVGSVINLNFVLTANKVYTSKIFNTIFKDFLEINDGQIFVENDIDTMMSAQGSSVCIKIEVRQEAPARVIIECYKSI